MNEVGYKKKINEEINDAIMKIVRQKLLEEWQENRVKYKNCHNKKGERNDR